MRLAAAGGVLLVALSAGVQAQSVSRPCRIAFEETTHGGDVMVTRGEVQLGPIMRQQDGSFMIMGQGQATITYRPGGGCTATAGSPFTARYTAILSGRRDTVTVDLAPLDFSSDWITVRCGADVFRNRAIVNAPPSVTLELRDAASDDYSYSEGAGIHEGGAAGSVTMHYCSG
jgi:hypothetical protein